MFNVIYHEKNQNLVLFHLTTANKFELPYASTLNCFHVCFLKELYLSCKFET